MKRIIAQPAFRSKNPYTTCLYTNLQNMEGVHIDEFSLSRLLFGKYDIWHRHWPDRSLNHSNIAIVYIKVLATIICTAIAKIKGIKIIWTIHNLKSHHNYYPRLEEIFWKLFIRTLDGYICLSRISVELAKSRFPQLSRLPGVVNYHPHYQQNYRNDVSSREARKHLAIDLDSRVILLLGNISEYKNIPEFIEIFKQSKDKSLILCIAGKPVNHQIEQRIRQVAKSDSRVKLNLGYIDNHDIQYFMNAADLVVTPYRETLNSGVILLALSFNRPFLAPAVGSVSEIAEIVGEQWAFTYEHHLDTTCLNQAIVWATEREHVSQSPIQSFAPEEIAKSTDAAYEIFLDQSAIPKPEEISVKN